jgi:hypothetical protein
MWVIVQAHVVRLRERGLDGVVALRHILRIPVRHRRSRRHLERTIRGRRELGVVQHLPGFHFLRIDLALPSRH